MAVLLKEVTDLNIEFSTWGLQDFKGVGAVYGIPCEIHDPEKFLFYHVGVEPIDFVFAFDKVGKNDNVIDSGEVFGGMCS